MGILRNEVSRQFIAVPDDRKDQIVYKWPDLNLRKGAKAIVNADEVALFVNNYRQGDEHRILEAVELPDDECDLHWLLMDVIKVLEKNPEADCSRLGVIGYALTPCETCRFYAARLLLNQQAAREVRGIARRRGFCR